MYIHNVPKHHERGETIWRHDTKNLSGGVSLPLPDIKSTTCNRLIDLPSPEYWSRHSSVETDPRTVLGDAYKLSSYRMNNINCLLEDFMRELPKDERDNEEQVVFT